jgi:single-stranded DNA-binding protein
MADYCRVTVVGNLSSAIKQVRAEHISHQIIGVTTICVARMQLVNGEPHSETVPIPVEIIGGSRSARIAQLFGVGSRIIIDGHLALRETATEEQITTLDGQFIGTAMVSRIRLVLVVDAIFNADLPEIDTPRAQERAV